MASSHFLSNSYSRRPVQRTRIPNPQPELLLCSEQPKGREWRAYIMSKLMRTDPVVAPCGACSEWPPKLFSGCRFLSSRFGNKLFAGKWLVPDVSQQNTRVIFRFDF